ncbi:hypothetical protein HPB48_011679 [Haemaphysalis longicornis]|uniref:Endonuclease/exonuclease/phosphatase domain-containing protein n=1 Tax=Haemaphysalis longicornis TaxID=44386 RepID=A0A9J6G861_HAELO|nr:hypothetical protein HPB48_011679 [Haemaphysalis longicornis]
MVEIENLLHTVEGKHFLITGDFNAKNPLWGGSIADRRGDEVISFINANSLNILNNSWSIPTLETVNGKSWIDLSLAFIELTTEINKWEVLEQHSNSDHKYIMINIFKTEKQKERRLTKKGKLNILRDLRDDPWHGRWMRAHARCGLPRRPDFNGRGREWRCLRLPPLDSLAALAFGDWFRDGAGRSP